VIRRELDLERGELLFAQVYPQPGKIIKIPNAGLRHSLKETTMNTKLKRVFAGVGIALLVLVLGHTPGPDRRFPHLCLR
jgi:hypothetical protein